VRTHGNAVGARRWHGHHALDHMSSFGAKAWTCGEQWSGPVGVQIWACYGPNLDMG
jgi:hypothetical protein